MIELDRAEEMVETGDLGGIGEDHGAVGKDGTTGVCPAATRRE